MPVCMVNEWNEYLDYELETLTRAIVGAVPAINQMGGGGGGSSEIRLTDPDRIGGFLDSLNRG